MNCMENNYEKEEEINILAIVFKHLQILGKRKKFIIILVVLSTFFTALYSLFMPDIYASKVVIMPISEQSTSAQELALASQFGGLVGMTPSSSEISLEIQNLLSSTIVREKLLNDYNLYPIIFYQSWDAEKKQWKEPTGIQVTIQKIISMPRSLKSSIGKNIKKAVVGEDTTLAKTEIDTFPTLYDGLNALNGILFVNTNIEKNIIEIIVQFPNPIQAKNIAEYTVNTLRNYMIEEAKKEALAKKSILEEQLKKTYDPIMQQKLYALITSQIETIIMAEAREGFAFKIVDIPRVPKEKIKPGRTKMVLMSFFASTFIGASLALFFEYYKKVYKKIKEMSKTNETNKEKE